MTSITRTKRLNRKLFSSISCGLLICCFTLLLVIERHYTEKVDSAEKIRSKKLHECYQRITIRHTNDYAIKYLEDVMEPSRKPITGENIFFHETTCSRSGLVHLTSRQACAIESAAKMNPEREVFVLFASPVGFRDGVAHLPSSVEALKTYPNIQLRNNNLWKYAEDTPIEKWMGNGSFSESMYLNDDHMSDVLRFLTLYKFGGIYLDLDVIVQQSFDDLGSNFAGDYSDLGIGTGILHFGRDKLGRTMAEQCIEFLIYNFNGKLYVDNGPLVITKTLERLCETENRSLMTRKKCKGFHIYPTRTFYPISLADWKWFFDPSMANHTLELTKNSTVIHVRNDMSKNPKVKIGAHTAYEMAAKLNCPNVYQSRINYEHF